MNTIIFLFLAAITLPVCAMEEIAYQDPNYIPKFHDALKDLNSLREMLNALEIEEPKPWNDDSTIANVAIRLKEWFEHAKEKSPEQARFLLKNKWRVENPDAKQQRILRVHVHLEIKSWPERQNADNNQAVSDWLTKLARALLDRINRNYDSPYWARNDRATSGIRILLKNIPKSYPLKMSAHFAIGEASQGWYSLYPL